MINPHHLRYFVDAARKRSLSEAAQINHVSQSAVSQAIRALERSFGFPLTTHQQKVFHLTDEGKAVLEHSDSVFQSLQSLSDAIKEIRSDHSGPLSIACTNTLATGLLPSILASLCKQHPKLRPVVRIGNSETIKNWLLQREVDLGLMVDDGFLTREFKTSVIRSGEYVLFGKKGARLRSKPRSQSVDEKERKCNTI